MNTSNRNIWVKSCPTCDKKMRYKTRPILNKSIKLNRYCARCSSISHNCIGKKFGNIEIVNQYIGSDGKSLVDYKCNCGSVKVGMHLSNVKRQKNCDRCKPRGLVRKKYGESSFNNLYNQYKQNTRIRSYDFQLTREEFKILTLEPCFYCGCPPSSIIHNPKSYGEYKYNGIDRKNNKSGYIHGNVVPCCKFCNLTKNKTSFPEFIKWIRIVDENTKNINVD